MPPMPPSDAQAAALYKHVLAQMESNVEFLVSQNYISSNDASTILARLPNSQNRTYKAFASAAASPSLPSPTFTPPALKRAVPAPPPPPAYVTQARALWSYNEGAEDPSDLSFSEGDIIEIVAETNADWWTGRVNGRQGLFPANYVEKISSSGSEKANPTATMHSVPPIQSEKKAYKPFMAARHGIDTPPPPGQGANSLGLQQASGQEAKASKYGAYKNTMAHSAAAGVGAGAGMAIGGGLVRAIF